MMNRFSFLSRTAAIACLVLVCAGANARAASNPHPNWLAWSYGSTAPAGNGTDVDEFIGLSTHLGFFCGDGFHALNPLDFTFEGEATWTAIDGAKLYVRYAGQVFPSGDPDFPFGFVAEITAVGGTRHLARTTGSGVMTGGFTGVPGEFYFEVEGNLRTRRR